MKNFSAYNHLLLKGFHMVSSETMWHVARVQKRVSKFVNFKVQKVGFCPAVELVIKKILEFIFSILF